MTNVNGTTNFPIPDSPPFQDWRGLIFEEDEGMWIGLNGFFVGTNNAGSGGVSKQLPVPVYWDTPQRQMNPQDQGTNQGDNRGVPQRRYPNIMLSCVDVRRDPEREQRSYTQQTIYQPNSGNLLEGGGTATIEMPIPMSIIYQVSVNASNMQHVRQLANILTYQFLLPRMGVLMCPSGTVRRLDIVSGPKPAQQLTVDKQRIFRMVWIVAISSEIEYGSVSGTLVEEVLLSVSDGGVPTSSGGTTPVLLTDNITVTAS